MAAPYVHLSYITICDLDPVGYIGHIYTAVLGTGDGERVDWMTTTPYVLGTLIVYVDGAVQIPTPLDPSAGTFRLSFAPATGETVAAQWEVAGG